MENLKELLYKVNHDKVAEMISEMLTDEDVKTYDMFENIACAYTDGNEDFRKGMEKMFEILTWSNLEGFVDRVKDFCLKEN